MVDLILLPPMGHDHKFYEQLTPYLENDFHLHLYDYPDDLSFKTDPLEELAQLFAKKINQIQRPVILAGLSLGATLSFRIKEILGDKVLHIFAMATGGKKVTRARKDMIYYALEHMGPEDLIEKSLGLEDNKFIEHFSQNDKIANDYLSYLQQIWQQKFVNQKTEQFIQLITAAVEVDYEKQMQDYQSQTTVIWGGSDKVFSMRQLKSLQKVMPQMKLELFPHLGHYLPLESPQEVAKIMLKHEISTL